MAPMGDEDIILGWWNWDPGDSAPSKSLDDVPAERRSEVEAQLKDKAKARRKIAKRKRRLEKSKEGQDPVDYKAILDRDKGICYLCEKEIMEEDTLHYDHRVPLAKGGKTSTDNMYMTHSVCNIRKGSKLEKTYRRLYPNN